MELQDYDIEGYKMILGWGKAVKINSAPFVLPPSASTVGGVGGGFSSKVSGLEYVLGVVVVILDVSPRTLIVALHEL